MEEVKAQKSPEAKALQELKHSKSVMKNESKEDSLQDASEDYFAASIDEQAEPQRRCDTEV